MKKLPDAELELMMIIWNAEGPISRLEIEEQMTSGKKVVPSTILSLLSRLEERGFVAQKKRGKMNYYTPLVEKDPYLKETAKSFLDRMYESSIAKFAASLYAGEQLSAKDIEELQAFIDEKSNQSK